jgi:MFS family permease
MLLSQTNNIWFLIAIYGFVISIAAGGASLVTIHVVLARWFYRRRSIVLSISTAGATAGALVLAPFASYLILFAGWRISWFALGAIVLFLAFPLALLFIRDDPSKLGELPDGDVETFTDGVSSRRSSERRGPLETENWADSYRTVPMWQLTGAYFVCGMTTAIISAHFVPYAIDKDISPEIAALAFGMMSGFNIVGVLLAGSLSGKLGTKNTLGAVYALRGVAYSMLLFMPGSIGIWLFALIAGFSWIASASLTSSLTAEIYGLRNMGTLGGMATFAHQMGGALSIFLGGVMYDWLGSYFVPFGIAGSLLIGASIAGFTIKEKKYSARYQPVTAQPAIAPAGDGD